MPLGEHGTDQAGADHGSAPGQRPYAVMDLDGVVADVRHRLHHVQARPKDWEAFFAAADHDDPLAEGLAVAHELAREHELVYLTGRPERLRRATLRWLSAAGLPEGRLFMRRGGDRRPARLTKVERLRRLAAERPVAVLVDDDEAVVAAARAAGFDVLHATWMDEAPQERAGLREAQEGEGRT